MNYTNKQVELILNRVWEDRLKGGGWKDKETFINTMKQSENLTITYVGNGEVELAELKELYASKCIQKRQLEKDLYEANKLLIDNGLKHNPIKKKYRSS